VFKSPYGLNLEKSANISHFDNFLSEIVAISYYFKRAFATLDKRKIMQENGSTRVSWEKLRSQFHDWNLKILIAEENGEVLGSVAYNNEHWGEESEWFIVSESPSRKFIENVLIREIEKYVKDEAVFTVVDAGSPKIGEWAERGYKPEGGLYHMVAGLEGLKPLPKLLEGVIARSLQSEEEKEFVEAVNVGFGWERLRLGVIQKWKSECPSFSEEWIHVVELDSEIV